MAVLILLTLVFKVITCFVELQAEREREEEERRKAEEEMLKEMAEQERLEYERKKREEEEQRRLQEEQDRYFINDIIFSTILGKCDIMRRNQLHIA